MKTYKNLWTEFISFENLFMAAIKSQRGKRYKPAVLEYNANLEENLLIMQNELETDTYQPGTYHQFKIYEPKERDIFAAPYKDRIVHHALISIIEPVFEPAFYYHSYACRIDKGTYKAINIAQKYLRQNKYVLKCDIEKYFPTIDHQILFSILRKKIADKRILNLIKTDNKLISTG